MYLISQLAKNSQLSIDAIRFYEKKGLIQANLTAKNNYRYYSNSTLARLIFIKNCRQVDLSIIEITELLHQMDQPDACCDQVNQLIDQHILQLDEKIKQLLAFKTYLQDARAKCTSSNTIKECLILKKLEDSQDLI